MSTPKGNAPQSPGAHPIEEEKTWPLSGLDFQVKVLKMFGGLSPHALGEELAEAVALLSGPLPSEEGTT